MNTRSAQAKTLYKIDKLVSIWCPSNLNSPFWSPAVRGALRYRKWQGCLGHVLTKFWSLEGQEAGNIWKETIFWNFLNLLDFIEAMGPYWSRVHAPSTPILISESSPIRPNFKLWKWKSNVNTRSAQAKPLYKIKKIFVWGSFKPELSILESCCA